MVEPTVNAFFDESGKFKNHTVVSFCGVLSAPAQFQSFSVDWGVCLPENGLQMLTAKHALNAGIPLSEKNPALGIEKRIAALLPFVGCIRRHLEAATGIAIDVKAFNASFRVANYKTIVLSATLEAISTRTTRPLSGETIQIRSASNETTR